MDYQLLLNLNFLLFHFVYYLHYPKQSQLLDKTGKESKILSCASAAFLNAIKEITNEEVTITYSGRTDAGVSAYGQVISFKTNTDIPVDRLPLALNSHLKKSIIVQSAEEVSDNFHPRYSCKGKKY